MTERPIIFSTPMVQALLAGRKTQTRRLLKPQPEISEGTFCYPGKGSKKNMIFHGSYGFLKIAPTLFSSHGKPGDWLWVRETWGFFDVSKSRVIYKADDPFISHTGWWNPSIFMPRWASRITLEIRDVRVERLQDITPWDADEEGIEYTTMQTAAEPQRVYREYSCPDTVTFDAITSYQSLWNSINGKKAPWSSNPWVWVYSFKVIGKPEGASHDNPRP